MSTVSARRRHTVLDVDPVRNPYAPGAGQRPPELAGRDAELAAFDVVLERIAHGRPERSLVLTGLRGVGKTVLLNQLRSAAISRGWGTGKIEARPDQSLRRPLSAALHMALRELRHPDQESTDAVLGVLKAFVQRQPADVGKGVALFIDEMQDVQADDVSAICAACHELSQQGAPLIVVGAGLPHLPAVLSASKSYSERLFRYLRIDRLDRPAADRALLAPAEREEVTFEPEALDALYAAADGYPYFVQAYGKVTWDVAAASPITAADVAMAAPVAEAELAVGFFGSRYDRATPAEREYMHAMAELGGPAGAAVATSEVASSLGRKPASLSPARDSLIKKGLVFSAERGQIAFTVPHFGRYLLRHATD